MDDAASGYGLIEGAGLAIADGRIAWLGSMQDCPADITKLPPYYCGGRLVTPALIDCHTHIVHGGNRALEFEMRLEGASYEEIARAGGGIVSTVTATRETRHEDLLTAALRRADALIAEGVATIEIKSGYGLDLDTELKMLRVARAVANTRPIHVSTSFLGAHAVPAGADADTYIDEVCIPALKAAHAEGLVDAVDGFCEGIAFDAAQICRVFEVAQALGLPVKLHAEQLSNTGGTALAAEFGALSADHVEYASDTDAQALARSGSVAVILPGAFYAIREERVPP
ncbi:MAG: imidazolonepropionase, partial [Pseudomonadota bacterium]